METRCCGRAIVQRSLLAAQLPQQLLAFFNFLKAVNNLLLPFVILGIQLINIEAISLTGGHDDGLIIDMQRDAVAVRHFLGQHFLSPCLNLALVPLGIHDSIQLDAVQTEQSADIPFRAI